MTIDKVLYPTGERNDHENARADTLTGEFPIGEWPRRMTSLADFESVLPSPAEAFRNGMWLIRCEDCDPKRGGYYWFSLGQCDTPAKALDCIIQLNEKRLSPVVMQSFIELMEYLFGRGVITDE
jgi:hypothetical protein